MLSTSEKLYIKKISRSLLISNSELCKLIFDLVSPSYVNVNAIIKRELSYCDQVYLGYDGSSNLITFFMVGRDDIKINDQATPTYYLGLSATSSSTKNSGLVRLLYQAFINDIQQLEEEIGQRVILWHTTATPSAFHAVNLLFVENEPSEDGSYSNKSEIIALAIRHKKGWGTTNLRHPFILHGVAHNTLYSTQEAERLRNICLKKKFTLFNELGINERQGDRLLRISYVPLLQNRISNNFFNVKQQHHATNEKGEKLHAQLSAKL
jgi:hypothetical protein